MITHRFMWLFACALFVAAGFAVSVTRPTTSVFALFPACAFLAAIVRIHYNLFTIDADAPSPLSLVMANVGSYAFVGGIAMVAFIGLSALMGAWVLVVCALLAGSSPEAMRLYSRRFARVVVATSHRASSDNLPPTEHPPRAFEREARALTDTELCQVWQASFHALRAETSPILQARIVDTRQGVLDEFARRNAAGLNAWISSGTEALEDASPVFSSAQRVDNLIDWDALIRGPDDS
jgi:hypothetical protein